MCSEMASHAQWCIVNRSNGGGCIICALLIWTQMLMGMQTLCISLDFELLFWKGTCLLYPVSNLPVLCKCPRYLTEFKAARGHLHLVNWIVILVYTVYPGSLYIKGGHLNSDVVVNCPIPPNEMNWSLKIQCQPLLLLTMNFLLQQLNLSPPSHFWHFKCF